jgi:hypothetical protein
MPGYVQAQRAPARQKSADNGAAGRRPGAMRDGATTRHGVLADALTASPQVQSLLQMRRAFDESPRVQSQLALQRALNRTNAPEVNEDERTDHDARSEPAQLAAVPGNADPPPAPVQRKPKATGLPDQLKDGVEQLSGLEMGDVRVHFNSAKPAAVQAHAYAQGTDIHLAPGQEKHLPHEAWHVVQQKQGRVKPTLQMKGVAINGDAVIQRALARKMVDNQFVYWWTDDPEKKKFASEKEARAYAAIYRAGWQKQKAAGLGAAGESAAAAAPKHQVADLKIEQKQEANDEKIIAPAQDVAHDPWAFGKTGHGSAVVPDLPDELVKKIQAAKSDGDRQKVLEELYQLLQARGIVHKKIIQAGLSMKYVTIKKEEFGQFLSYSNKPPELEITPDAFASAPLLYSTIRHELIHGEQFRLEDRENVKAGDKPEFVYQDLDQQHSSIGAAFVENASEVETHAWEIVASESTGTDAEYVKNRKEKLNGFMAGCNKDKPKAAKYKPLYDKALSRFKEASEHFRKLFPKDPLSEKDNEIEGGGTSTK